MSDEVEMCFCTLRLIHECINSASVNMYVHMNSVQQSMRSPLTTSCCDEDFTVTQYVDFRVKLPQL